MRILLFCLWLPSLALAGESWPSDLGPLVSSKIEKFLEGKNASAAVLSVRDFQGKILFEKSWGKTLDGRDADVHALFDMASVTKVITATLAMEAVQAGELKLEEPLSTYFPAYMGPAKLEDLLRHRAGLKAGLPLAAFQNGEEEAINKIIESAVPADVGKFKYSDLGYVLTGYLLGHLHHEPLDSLYQSLFRRLGMKESCFNGPSCESLKANFTGDGAPQEASGLLSHDPTARALPGTCGNAGFFTTVGDLAKFVTRFVSVDKPLLTPAARERMLEIDANGRAIGWDRGSKSTASLRGDILEAKDYMGHTGWTGVSVSVNLTRGYFVILLLNRTQSPHSEDETMPLVTQLRLEVHKAIHGILGVEK